MLPKMKVIMFWNIYFVMFLKIMIYKFVLNGAKMILQFGIIEVCSILLRITPSSQSVLIWNRNDYDGLRIGDRVVSVGEHPYFDPLSKSRREALRG